MQQIGHKTIINTTRPFTSFLFFWKEVLCLSFTFLLLANTVAQPINFQLRIEADTFPPPITHFQQTLTFKDTISAFEFLQKTLKTLKSNGYLSANIDAWDTQNGRARLYVGKPWIWKLEADSSAHTIWQALGLLPQTRKLQPAQSKVATAILERTVRYCENHGYPFAKAQWDFRRKAPLQMEALLQLDKGLLITFDTLELKGDAFVKQRFLANYLYLQPNQPFSQKHLEEVQNALAQLPYLSLQKPLQTSFLFDKAFPILHLQKKEANSINGVIGLLLDRARQQRPVITGELALQLMNPFGAGRKLQLGYRRLKVASQQLQLAYSQPALFGTRFDISGDFSYFKEDSTYLNLQASIELAYRLSYRSQWRLQLATYDHRLDSRIASAPRSFADLGSTSYNSYGLGYRYQGLDNLLLPRKGWQFSILLQLGNKRLRPTLSIESPDYDDLYGDLPLNAIQFQWDLQLEKYWRASQSLTIRYQGKGKGLFSPLLFQNDLFRMGGLQSLRGFNENFFFASNYWVNTLEGRIYFGKQGYVSLFADQAYVQHEVTNGESRQDWPVGVGLGLSFGTQAGLFNFAYALGTSKEQSLDFRTAKVHFGLTSIF